MQDLLLVLGLVLFLLGLLTGLAIPILKNPRMGVASHLQGMTNGPFLVLIGLMWPYLHLSQTWEIVAVVLLVYGTYANWLATQLGSLWGAGHRFAPGATGEHRAAATQERIVDLLLITLAPTMVIATVLLSRHSALIARYADERKLEPSRSVREFIVTSTVIKYQTKPERAEENTQLIAAVFAELDQRQPEGFTYKVFRLEDGASFIHVFIEHDIAVPDSLQELVSFKAFIAEIVERCDSPPVSAAATIVGGYR